MKVSELIAETRASLDDQSSLVKGDTDQLWSEERILRQLSRAERIFARETWVIVDDSTSAVVNITLVLNQPDYALHVSVLSVLSARLSDSDKVLGRRTWDQIYSTPAPDPDFFDLNAPLIYTPGRPVLYAMDAATRKITFWRKPDAAAATLTAKLRVARLPLSPLTKTSTPEIPEEYHQDLCDYAVGKLLKNTANNDTGEAQGEARRIGASLITDFKEAMKDAHRDVKRRNFPTPQWRLGGWADGD